MRERRASRYEVLLNFATGRRINGKNMYIFTKYGFYSVVCGRQGDRSKFQPVDPDVLQVRARVNAHLADLAARFPNLLNRRAIKESTDTDYRFRLIVDKMVWSQVMAQLATETDYDSFKTAVGREAGVSGRAYLDALHEVWAVTCKLQGKH